MVITRYLYKPTAIEGLTRFNDNKRLHLFVVDLASRQVRQLTTGTFYEHSLDWSPNGDETAVRLEPRSPTPTRSFNYDVFAVRVTDAAVRRLTNTKSAEYHAGLVARRHAASPSSAPSATSPRRKRRWRIRMCG